MAYSDFGKKLLQGSGILELMDDLGKALAQPQGKIMLGGGNPAHIPAIQDEIKQSWLELADQPDAFAAMVGNYDPPQGNPEMIEVLVDFFNRHYHWGISSQNIAITNGSQTGYFYLFNLFAGQIFLPVVPEYIGYLDQGIEPGKFVGQKPEIQMIKPDMFKYRLNVSQLDLPPGVDAVAVSRPTNPTGNVLTDQEIDQLSQLVRSHGKYLIIDNAYGMPFPQIMFAPGKLVWDQHIILSFSFSKLGFPTARTGIFVANAEIIKAMTAINAVVGLSSTSLAQYLLKDWFADDRIIKLSQQVIKPYYQAKAQQAVEIVRQQLAGVDYRIHQLEGSLFLWLWLPKLKITSKQLYQKLKQQGVLVVPGEYFFPPLLQKTDWQHTRQCLRINYAAADQSQFAQALSILKHLI